MSGRGFWSLFSAGPPAEYDRFTLEELQRLHSIVLRNQVVDDANRAVVVEALRSISELVIWGDQHESSSSMVEYFLTQNMLGHFARILQQRSNRRGNVAMQVLQTLSILVQNVRNEQTVYYLFSNNHINEIVSMRFDFEDDEVLGYYVNLLKTISLKLNEVTVQFFFQAQPGHPPSFPLYTEAIKFVNHRDGMVRTAVKTLTLNVFAIPLPSVQQFVTSRPAAQFFSQLATYIAEQCQVLDRLLSSLDVSNKQTPSQVEACLAEIEDLLSYCNDVLSTGVEPLRALLLDCLWQAFVGPVLFWPLIQEDVAAQHIAALTLGPGSGSNGSAGASLAMAAGSGSGRQSPGLSPRGAGAGGAVSVQRGTVGPLCSLYVFERLFQAITDQSLLGLLVAALLGGAACGGASPAARSSPVGGAHCRPPASVDQQLPIDSPWSIPVHLLVRLQYSPAAYRRAVLGMLRGQDAQVAAAAMRVIASLLHSRAVDEGLLELVGLLPRRRKKQRQLLQALTGELPEEADDSSGVESALPAGNTVVHVLAEQQHQDEMAAAPGAQRSSKDGGAAASPNGTAELLTSASDRRDSSAIASPSVSVSVQVDADGSIAVRFQVPQQQQQRAAVQGTGPGSTGQPPPQQQQQQQQAPGRHHPAYESPEKAPTACSTAYGESNFQEVTAALVQLLAAELLPPVSLAVVGWLLHRLLSTGAAPSSLAGIKASSAPKTAALELPAAHAAVLEGAGQRLRGRLQQQLHGPWCDALTPLIAAEWARTRQVILRTGAGSVHFAVYTWMQAVLVQELQWQLLSSSSGGTSAEDTPAAAAAAPALPLGDAAAAAKQAYLTVQALVAVLQVKQLVAEGDISQLPPTPVVGDAELKSQAIKEGSQISLSARMHCTVAFTRGQERQVYFGVEGLPPHIKSEATDLSKLKPAALQLVAAAGPVVVVADPGSRPDTGLVLSAAPLMGADVAIDPTHPKWLHVSVRPPLRGLLKVVQASHPGNVLLNLQKHLVSGHWVLAFPDADRAASAAQHVEIWLHRMRVVYCQLLAPLECM